MTTSLELRQDVLDELEFEPSVNAAHVGVAVEKDVVTLTGYVECYAQKVAAIRAARRVKGVHGIADEIQVRFMDATADDEIARRALDVIKWDTALPDDLKVIVREGLITLSGTVNWQYQKAAAEKSIRNLKGVRGIINNIEIKPTARPENIKKRIEDALKRHAEIESRAIRVTIHDDTVVLEGEVDNWDERYAVEQAAWSAPGVRQVDDRLRIG